MQNYLVLNPLGEAYGVTISQTAALLSSLVTIPSDALSALIQVETDDIRVRYNATTNVTGGVGGGHLLVAGESVVVIGWGNLSRMALRRDGATNGFINIVFSGEGQPA